MCEPPGLVDTGVVPLAAEGLLMLFIQSSFGGGRPASFGLNASLVVMSRPFKPHHEQCRVVLWLDPWLFLMSHIMFLSRRSGRDL